jgi:hypothetical protein
VNSGEYGYHKKVKFYGRVSIYRKKVKFYGIISSYRKKVKFYGTISRHYIKRHEHEIG